MADHDEIIETFRQTTSATQQQAEDYLSATDYDIESAVAAYFADQDEADDQEDAGAAGASSTEVDPDYTGPRTLDGRPAPQSELSGSSSRATKAQPKRKGIATLGSMGGSSQQHDGADEDDGDDEDGARGPRDLFAGGEKSGLAVQDPAQQNNPRKLIQDIIAKARANASRPAEGSPAGPSQSSPFFRGTGHTVGGDGVESRAIPDPRGQAIPRQTPANVETQERVLHLWSDGFSIDDGELHRFDDPENAMDLAMIRQGRAPLRLMNVQYGQPVDVKLAQHEETWHQLPKVYRPFGGEGRRLGSPVPGDSSASVGIAPTPLATTMTAGTTQSPATTDVDDSQPTIVIRIQMPDGTRLPARFNTTQTVEDVYDFVQRASADTRSRPWVLATTFPNKDHTDRDLVLGEMGEFKRGGTAVVKWT